MQEKPNGHGLTKVWYVCIDIMYRYGVYTLHMFSSKITFDEGPEREDVEPAEFVEDLLGLL